MTLPAVRVDDAGVWAESSTEVVLDVHFDGRRIWSFWLHRDGEASGSGHLVRWPAALRDFLDGTAEISVVEHLADEPAFREEVSLGSGEGRIAIVNARGVPVALDKSLRRVTTFDTRSAEHVKPLLDSIEEVLRVLREVGTEAFLAYGTLLGAVRDGRLIGHDSDADLAYVSSYDDPADVALESFRLQRALAEQGYQVTRYSGAAIKIDVVEADGSVRGLDLFGGFVRDGFLHLMGEIRAPFEREWIVPLSTAELEGRSFPVPAEPERLLAVTYGESWRVPDPAFHFDTPASTSRRLNGWFRGIRQGRAEWDRLYHSGEFRGRKPSGFVRWVLRREPQAGSFVDIGCGRGRDASFVAGRGVPTLALEQSATYYRHQAAGWEPGTGPEFTTFNLLESRHVAVAAARGALLPGPRVLQARHVLDATSTDGWEGLFRTAAGMLHDGDGRLYLAFLVRNGDDDFAAARQVHEVDPDRVEAALARWGAEVTFRDVRANGPHAEASLLCRMVAQWPSRTERGAHG